MLGYSKSLWFKIPILTGAFCGTLLWSTSDLCVVVVAKKDHLVYFSGIQTYYILYRLDYSCIGRVFYL